MDLTNTARTRRALPYKQTKATIVAPVDTGEDVGAVVFEGESVKNEGDFFLVFQEGRAQQAIPVAALSAALYAGVIPRAAVERLWALKVEDDARNAPPAPTVPAPPAAPAKAK